MLQGEGPCASAGIGAGLSGATNLDPGADQRAQGVVRSSFFGQQDNVAVVLACESEQPSLPRFTTRWGGALGEIENDNAKSTAAQEQLGGFAQGVRLSASRVGATGKGDMDDEQGIEVDAACSKVGRVEGACAGLNPRRRFSSLLCIPQDPNRSGSPRGRDGAFEVSRELEQAARTDRFIQGLEVVTLAAGCFGLGGRTGNMRQAKQRSVHTDMLLFVGSVSRRHELNQNAYSPRSAKTDTSTA